MQYNAITRHKTPTPGRLPQQCAIDFMTSGKAIFTFVSLNTGTRFTYKIEKPHDEKPETANVLFVKLLTGSDNENDFTYFGYLKKNGGQWNFAVGKKSHITESAKSVIAFTHCFGFLKNRRENTNLEIWHEGRCGRCGRLLTDPTSVEIGIGPECRHKQSLTK